MLSNVFRFRPKKIPVVQVSYCEKIRFSRSEKKFNFFHGFSGFVIILFHNYYCNNTCYLAPHMLSPQPRKENRVAWSIASKKNNMVGRKK